LARRDGVGGLKQHKSCEFAEKVIKNSVGCCS
jgi:hypothetical protein